ncbi:MAG TPA: hypothetical protein PK511_12625 [Chitinophagales bacterium]|nr:hypothetical protein [Chitinophagales bacterium]HMX04189.1 hypothetical protein [Chitinophagales bacterium]HNA58067.1 hypothetical protein [Chitinophagales bacterium]HNE46169.1 hypothetical protein [Chitinophagales bacterium]HNF68612.1 hypothetical protein [Chitinophagales bacterium]
MKYFAHALKIVLLLLLVCCFNIPEAEAHVKWFTDGSYADRPLRLGEILEGRFFYTLFFVTLGTVAIGVWLDARISKANWYMRVDNWLDSRKSYATIVLRVAAAMVLILSWQSNAMIVPTIPIPANYEWLGWFQFLMAFMLLMPKTVPIGGLGIVVIWVIGNITLHPFHMLDYLMFAGVGVYLVMASIKNGKYKDSGLVVLYVTVGFSLCWVALEKFVYPNWSLFLIKEHPNLAMGLNFDFFLKSVGFVEFGLGFLLLVCLLQRPLAIIITVTFFITSSVFGKVEIIGHTLIHGALIVFLLEGPGRFYLQLRQRFSKMTMRIGFTIVNFTLLFVVLTLGYTTLANNKYEKKIEFLSKKPEFQRGQIELAGYPKSELPGVWMEITKDAKDGYNIHFNTTNFQFAPDKVNTEHVMGEGSINLFINGDKVARVYGEWYHIDIAAPGTYEVVATLNSNELSDYCIRGTPISAREKITVSR